MSEQAQPNPTNNIEYGVPTPVDGERTDAGFYTIGRSDGSTSEWLFVAETTVQSKTSGEDVHMAYVQSPQPEHNESGEVLLNAAGNPIYKGKWLPYDGMVDRSRKLREERRQHLPRRAGEVAAKQTAEIIHDAPETKGHDVDAIDNMWASKIVPEAKPAMIDHVPGVTRQEEPVLESEGQPEERQFWGDPRRVVGHPSNPTNGARDAFAEQQRMRQDAHERMED